MNLKRLVTYFVSVAMIFSIFPVGVVANSWSYQETELQPYEKQFDKIKRFDFVGDYKSLRVPRMIRRVNRLNACKGFSDLRRKYDIVYNVSSRISNSETGFKVAVSTEGYQLSGLKVDVYRSGTDSLVDTFNLYDDGLHSDMEELDGIYGNFWTSDVVGFYDLKVSVLQGGEYCSNLFDPIGVEINNKIACREVVPGHNEKAADRINMVFMGVNLDESSMFEEGVSLQTMAQQMIDFDNEPYIHSFETDPSEGGEDKRLQIGFFAIEPFKSNKDKFNIWYFSKNLVGESEVQVTNQVGSRLYSSIVPFCNLENVAPVYLNAGTFHDNGSSAYAYLANIGDAQNVLKDNLKFGSAFIRINSADLGNQFVHRHTTMHELGHSIGGLEDEYSDHGETRNRGAAVNCASSLDDAESKWGELLGMVDPFYFEYIELLESYDVSYDYTVDDIAIGYFAGGCGYQDGSEEAFRPSRSSLMISGGMWSQDGGLIAEIPVLGSVNRDRFEKILALFDGN